MITIEESRLGNAIRDKVNNVKNTYDYLSGDRDSKYDYRYKSSKEELDDTEFKKYSNINKFKYDAKTDEKNGMVRVEFSADKVPTELADQINPTNPKTLYKYVTGYKDGKVVMEFPMTSRMSKSSKERTRRDPVDHGTLNGKRVTGNESVMTPTPIPYQNREGNDRWYEEENEPLFLEVKTDEDTGEVSVENKDTDIYVMTDVKVSESVGLEETPGLKLSDPSIKDSKLVIEINGKKYEYKVKDDSDKTPEDIATSVIKMKKFSDGKALAYLKKNMELVKESLNEVAYVSDDFKGSGIDDLITDINNSTREFLISINKNPDNFSIDFDDEENIWIRVNVPGLSEEDFRDLSDILDEIIVQYDRESYFEISEEANDTIEAWLDRANISPRMIGEGNSFKDHHICQGCGKPLSKCTCDVSEEDIDLTEDVGNSVSDEEIIKAVTNHYGTVDLPYDGPSFIMPDGSFLNIQSAKNHSDVEYWLDQNGMSKYSDYNRRSGSPTLKSVGCIRVDTPKYYIQLPDDNITGRQYSSLKDWIDYLMSLSVPFLEVVAPGAHPVRYDFKDDGVDPQYVVNRVRRYYVSGNLYETNTDNADGPYLRDEATQVSNVGQHKTDSIDLIEDDELGSTDIVPYTKWNSQVYKGLTVESRLGNRVTVTDITTKISKYNGEPDLSIYYDYELTSGESGSGSCTAYSFWKMVSEK